MTHIFSVQLMPGGFVELSTNRYSSARRAFTILTGDGFATELSCRLVCLDDTTNTMMCDFYVHDQENKWCQLGNFEHDQSQPHEGTFSSNPLLQIREGKNFYNCRAVPYPA